MIDFGSEASTDPFGRPKGTVRAILTLLIAAGVLGLQAYITIHVGVDETIPLWLQIAFGSVVATYFVQRPGETKANETVAAVRQLERRIAGPADADLIPGARLQLHAARSRAVWPVVADEQSDADNAPPYPWRWHPACTAGHRAYPTIVTADGWRHCGFCGAPLHIEGQPAGTTPAPDPAMDPAT